MQRLRRLFFAALLVLVAASCADDQSSEPTPIEPVDQYDQLSEPVEIRVDDVGIPHIYAQNDMDLFFAAGYRQASDRLFALEMTRRKANGTYAEVVGEEGFSTDIQSRTLGFRRWAGPTIELMREEQTEEYNAIVAFVGGINRRVAEINAGEAALPDGFARHGIDPRPFEPADVMAIGNRIQFGFSSTLEFDLLNTVVDKVAPGAAELAIFEPASKTAIVGTDTARQALEPMGPAPLDGQAGAPPRVELSDAQIRQITRAIERWQDALDVGEGSNSWAVRGEFMNNGKPLLANDSHAGLKDPNTLWLAHLNSKDAGGSWDAIGFSFTGVPGVQLGHNEAFAWGATTNFADMLDLWDVEVTDEQVDYGGEMLDVVTREETIRVRQEDGSFAERTVEVREVPGVGVLLPDALLPLPANLIANGELLVGWPGFKPSRDFKFFATLPRTHSLDEFKDTVGLIETGMQNWTGMTKDGIRYGTHGLVPDRGPVDGRPRANQIMDGSDPANVWTGQMLPDERFPWLDGSQPFIVTANNDPFGHTFDGDPLNDEFYYGSFYAPAFRAGRLTARLGELTARGAITLEEMEALQMDVHSPLAERSVPFLVDAVDRVVDQEAYPDYQGRSDLSDAADSLAAWDLRMSADSHEAALFRVWFAFASRKLLADDMSLLFDAIESAQPVTITKFTLLALENQTDSLLDDDPDLALVEALDEALTVLDARQNPTWGELHVDEFEAPDGQRDAVARGGGDSTINVAQSKCWADTEIADKCRTGVGSVFRTLTTFDDDGTPVTWFNMPRGNAGQTTDWLDGNYVRWPFRRAEVEAATAEAITLQ